MRAGDDVTVVGWGSQLRTPARAASSPSRRASRASSRHADAVPADFDTVVRSVEKTGRLVVSHEAPRTSGFAAEIASTVAERCFLSLEAPVQRVCGYDTPFPLVFEKLYLPDVHKNVIRHVCSF